MTQFGSAHSRKIVETQFHGGTFSIESGWIAKQANGAVLVRHGDTVVLVTVCRAPAKKDQDFFPLVVEYQEKFYAAGKIPGGFFKREGKPGENEILSCRLIDRPIRPLFPDGYLDEVQVICTVLSSDGVSNPNILAMCGASAALHISDIPFHGPMAAVRVGRCQGKLMINPAKAQLEGADIDVVLAGTKDAIVMVEGGAKFVSERDFLDALYFGHTELQKIIALQDELRGKVGKEKLIPAPAVEDSVLGEKVRVLAHDRLRHALFIKEKLERRESVGKIKEETLAALKEEFPEKEKLIAKELEKLTEIVVRTRVVEEGIRIDGRSCTEVRPIEIDVGVIPRAHGSALFTRGETQAIVTATLGTSSDAQRIDSITESAEKHFMLHYNFPPYSTGEVKMLRGTGRREVGHGALAERALKMVLPGIKEFPYVVRVVSDITESNGSSSMASVCGGSLALMDAGVATREAVAGVAMGLIKEAGKVAVLTDILGDEDHLGDMDFKVCGTVSGLSAVQMDIKCQGLSRETMEQALEQARVARLHILEKMAQVISKSRDKLSPYAPSIQTIKINPERIKDVIGPGGKTIRSIVESTGVKIDISDDGSVNIASSDGESSKRAIAIIMGLTEEAEIGKIYSGVVKRIMDFGAFVEILPGTEGLVHISQLSHRQVDRVSDVVKEGEQIMVRVLDIDRQGRIRLSKKEAEDQRPSR